MVSRANLSNRGGFSGVLGRVYDPSSGVRMESNRRTGSGGVTDPQTKPRQGLGTKLRPQNEAPRKSKPSRVAMGNPIDAQLQRAKERSGRASMQEMAPGGVTAGVGRAAERLMQSTPNVGGTQSDNASLENTLRRSRSPRSRSGRILEP